MSRRKPTLDSFRSLVPDSADSFSKLLTALQKKALAAVTWDCPETLGDWTGQADALVEPWRAPSQHGKLSQLRCRLIATVRTQQEQGVAARPAG